VLVVAMALMPLLNTYDCEATCKRATHVRQPCERSYARSQQLMWRRRASTGVPGAAAQCGRRRWSPSSSSAARRDRARSSRTCAASCSTGGTPPSCRLAPGARDPVPPQHTITPQDGSSGESCVPCSKTCSHTP
jgi:hypothetical protein